MKTLLLRTLRAAYSERGSVALETMVSVMLLIVITIAACTVTILITNQHILSMNAEAAAQASLVVYDRQTRSGEDSGSARQAAGEVAHQVVEESNRGLLRAPVGGYTSSEAWNAGSYQLSCAPDYNASFGACSGQARFERAQVQLTLPIFAWSMVGMSGPTARQSVALTSSGTAFSSGPPRG